MKSTMRISAGTAPENAALHGTPVGATLGGMGGRPSHFGLGAEPRKRLGESPAPVKGAPHNLPDVICFSPVSWSAESRTRQLMSRCARGRRVFFVEDPLLVDDIAARLDASWREPGVWVVIPHLPSMMSAEERNGTLAMLMADFFQKYSIKDYILWYLTPGPLAFTRQLKPSALVYDSMDELATGSQGEMELLKLASLVFTNSSSGYDERRALHPNVHCLPCSADIRHFTQARRIADEPADQFTIPHPRLGFFGTIDDRLDLKLLDRVAEARPDWHLVLLGPVVNVDAAHLPDRPNVHYLGTKSFEELPAYLAGWDVAMLPMVRSDATRRASVTRVLEYLAAARPVVSTSVPEAVERFAKTGVVQIADTLAEFIIAAADAGMDQMYDNERWLAMADDLLERNSWESTWGHMERLLDAAVALRRSTAEALITG